MVSRLPKRLSRMPSTFGDADNYEAVMEVALRTGYIEEEDVETLNEWRKDPAHWNLVNKNLFVKC